MFGCRNSSSATNTFSSPKVTDSQIDIFVPTAVNNIKVSFYLQKFFVCSSCLSLVSNHFPRRFLKVCCYLAARIFFLNACCQSLVTFSKSMMETPEQCVKSDQS